MNNGSQIREKLAGTLAELREQGLFRVLPQLTTPIDFCSNDYLGLARENHLAPGIAASGATGSRLISGNSPLFEETEAQIADFHGAPSALIFSSGYLANLSLLSSLTDRHDTIIYDSLIHASLRDGIRLSHSHSFSFRHNDLNDLEKKLSAARGAKLIVVESIYSMDGDRASLNEIVDLAERFGAEVIVDEAHSIGIDGASGEGLVAALGLQGRVLARTVTFGKALGCHGAAVLSDTLVREALINLARGFIYTTAISPRALLDIQSAYRQLPQLEERRQKIKRLSTQFNEQSEWTPIHRVIIPGNKQVSEAATRLRFKNFGVVAIRAPSVAEGSERIRICLHSFNSEQEVRDLKNELSAYV